MVLNDFGMGQTANRHAVNSRIPAGAGLGSLWAACCERRLVIGRTLRARAHDAFHNVIIECSGFRMLGGRCEHFGDTGKTSVSPHLAGGGIRGNPGFPVFSRGLVYPYTVSHIP